MSYKSFVETLNKEFSIIIRSQYHIQIPIGGGFHDLWISKEGLKVKFYGERTVGLYNQKDLINRLKTYDYNKSDLSFMKSLEKLIQKIGSRKGIFTDAGYRDGKAKICVINMWNDGYDIYVREIETIGSLEAELAAIDLAISLYPKGTIYSDCKDAVELRKDQSVWLPRTLNKEADTFGNMRVSR